MVIFAVKFCKPLQCGWIFVQTAGTKYKLAVKVSPMLPLPWLVPEKNVTIWNFGFT